AEIQDLIDSRLWRKGLFGSPEGSSTTMHGLRVSRASGYRGVSPASNSRWRAAIQHDGKSRSLGIFDSRHEAALAYNLAGDILQIPYFVANAIASADKPAPTRHAEIEHLVEDKLMRQGILGYQEVEDGPAYRPHQVNAISGYRGVHWHRHSGRCTAVIDYEGKRHSLGYYPLVHEAALAHNCAVQFLFGGRGLLNEVTPENLPAPDRQQSISNSVEMRLRRLNLPRK